MVEALPQAALAADATIHFDAAEHSSDLRQLFGLANPIALNCR
jgi:hypothetical protein